MTARRKRSALGRASKRGKSQAKEPVDDFRMESYRLIGTKQVWKLKPYQDNVTGPIESNLTPKLKYLSRFQSVEQVAEWVFHAAKTRPLELDLKCCEQSEDVRDALLRQFHRWPELKISQAIERYQKLSQEVQQKCQKHVQLYVQELRGKLLGGASALFWLDVLYPLNHPETMPRTEALDSLMALEDELKGIDGLYELLNGTNDRLWTVLTLPLKLESLFQGVATLALCGYETAAKEAMQILTMFAEEYTGRMKRKLPIGLTVVASVGMLAPLDISGLSDLSEIFREDLSKPLIMMARDWVTVVGQMVDMLEKFLTTKWTVCERAPLEKEFNMSRQRDLQTAFERLSQALAMNQLYAMKKEAGERRIGDENCLKMNILRERGLLVVESELLT